MTFSVPRFLLQVEGLVVLVAACVAYGTLGASWAQFALLFFVPDLAMLGFLAGPTVGTWSYNAVHTYAGPALLAALAAASDQPALYPFCLVWIAHIGFDRLLGYGLKYPSAFKDTHFGRV